MLKEFKSFIMKGNVLELAVAVIMATYFGVIVKSLVDDIIMPPVGLAIGGVDFTELKFVIQDEVPAVMEGDAEVSAAVNEVAIYWGKFVNHIFTFVIVAFVIFLILRAYNKAQKEEEEAPAPDPGPSELDILKEIRDNLKK